MNELPRFRIETSLARVLFSPQGLSFLVMGALLALAASLTLPEGVRLLLTHANDNADTGGGGGGDGPENDDDDDDRYDDLYNPDWAPQ